MVKIDTKIELDLQHYTETEKNTISGCINNMYISNNFSRKDLIAKTLKIDTINLKNDSDSKSSNNSEDVILGILNKEEKPFKIDLLPGESNDKETKFKSVDDLISNELLLNKSKNIRKTLNSWKINHKDNNSFGEQKIPYYYRFRYIHNGVLRDPMFSILKSGSGFRGKSTAKNASIYEVDFIEAFYGVILTTMNIMSRGYAKNINEIFTKDMNVKSLTKDEVKIVRSVLFENKNLLELDYNIPVVKVLTIFYNFIKDNTEIEEDHNLNVTMPCIVSSNSVFLRLDKTIEKNKDRVYTYVINSMRTVTAQLFNIVLIALINKNYNFDFISETQDIQDMQDIDDEEIFKCKTNSDTVIQSVDNFKILLYQANRDKIRRTLKELIINFILDYTIKLNIEEVVRNEGKL